MAGRHHEVPHRAAGWRQHPVRATTDLPLADDWEAVDAKNRQSPAHNLRLHGVHGRSARPSPDGVLSRLFCCRYSRWFEAVKTLDSINDHRADPTQNKDGDNHKAQGAEIVVQTSDKIPDTATQL